MIGKLLKPEARKDIIEFFAKAGIVPTAMMDISDGLSSEIFISVSKVNLGCVLYEEKIPIAEEMKTAAYKFEIDPTACAFSGGEDYELLFTITQSDYDKLVLNEQISVVGYMTESGAGNNHHHKRRKQISDHCPGMDSFKAMNLRNAKKMPE